HQEGLVVSQPLERGDDRVEAFPVPGSLAGAAVDDELLGPLGHFGIEIVHQHPQRRFLLPSAAGNLGAARRANGAGFRDGGCHGLILCPWPARSRNASMRFWSASSECIRRRSARSTSPTPSSC